jgi:hypothetical protein
MPRPPWGARAKGLAVASSTETAEACDRHQPDVKDGKRQTSPAPTPMLQRHDVPMGRAGAGSGAGVCPYLRSAGPGRSAAAQGVRQISKACCPNRRPDTNHFRMRPGERDRARHGIGPGRQMQAPSRTTPRTLSHSFQTSARSSQYLPVYRQRVLESHVLRLIPSRDKPRSARRWRRPARP